MKPQRASLLLAPLRRDGFLPPTHLINIPLDNHKPTDTHTWIKPCPDCHSFVLANPLNQPGSQGLPSHHYRVVFTDGACPGNGGLYAKAGLGIVFKDSDDPRSTSKPGFAVPVTADIDPYTARRTSQRAELLAAIKALEMVRDDADRMRYAGCTWKLAVRRRPRWEPAWVVAADSEYVVKGMTEWLPRWKLRGGRKPDGQVPSNYDLFLRLESIVNEIEARNVQVGFLWIPRHKNGTADWLAKRAAGML